MELDQRPFGDSPKIKQTWIWCLINSEYQDSPSVLNYVHQLPQNGFDIDMLVHREINLFFVVYVKQEGGGYK